MEQLFTEKSFMEFEKRLESAIEALGERGCSRQEVFTLCLSIAPGIYNDIYSHQMTSSGAMFHPERVIAWVLAKVMEDYPA